MIRILPYLSHDQLAGRGTDRSAGGAQRCPVEAGLPGEPMYLRGEARTMTNEYVIAEVDYTAAIHADPETPDT